MTTRILINAEGDGLLVEAGSYLLWEPEFAILPPDRRNLYVFPKTRTFNVARSRDGIWVPPRPPGVTP